LLKYVPNPSTSLALSLIVRVKPEAILRLTTLRLSDTQTAPAPTARPSGVTPEPMVSRSFRVRESIREIV
jgi:hypothetical protein